MQFPVSGCGEEYKTEWLRGSGYLSYLVTSHKNNQNAIILCCRCGDNRIDSLALSVHMILIWLPG